MIRIFLFVYLFQASLWACTGCRRGDLPPHLKYPHFIDAPKKVFASPEEQKNQQENLFFINSLRKKLSRTDLPPQQVKKTPLSEEYRHQLTQPVP